MTETGTTQGETGAAILPPYNIKICTPVFDDTWNEHKIGLIESEKDGINFEYQICQSAMPALARNLLINEDGATTVKQTLTDKFTHYLFVDADIGWWPEDILGLLRRRKDIISAAYVARSVPDCYQAGKWEHTIGNPGALVSTTSTGLNKVHWVGAGFLLVTRRALERMDYPWFRHWLVSIDEEVGNGLVRRHAVESNEDCGFCVNATKAGIPIYLDCDQRVKHEIEDSVPELKLTPHVQHFFNKKSPGVSGTNG